MLILILILVFLIFIFKSNNFESFINFRLPNEGHWCKTNNCDYPVITLMKPNKENKILNQKLHPSGNLLPKNKNMNASCASCIIQNSDKCLYFTIDSKESILNISELFIEWFNLMDLKEKEFLLNKKVFIFKNNNLFYVNKKDENKEYKIKPAPITNNSRTVYGDEIKITGDNEISISIEFYVLLLVIFYKLYNSKDIKSNSNYINNNKKFIKNYINKICKNFSFNKIKDNKHIFDKRDDYFEKCNIDILDNSISEKVIHDFNKNLIEQTKNIIDRNYSESAMKINSIKRKNEYLSKIRDKNIHINEVEQERQTIYKKDNVMNEKCLTNSKYLDHAENRYSEIDGELYFHSCGNFYKNTEQNRIKFEKCDNFGIHNNLIPSLSCVKPKQDSHMGKIGNFDLYQEIEGCSITNNKGTVICEQKEFVFKDTNGMKLIDEKRC